LSSDELQNLKSEKLKREEILAQNPDLEWAKKDLKKINGQIADIENKEKQKKRSSDNQKKD